MDMENLVREALRCYGDILAAASLKRMGDQAFTPEQMESIRLAEAQARMIQVWLNMLSYDERFVVKAHLIDRLEWERVTHSYMKHWDELYTRSDRQLGSYQAQALKKITGFCGRYPDLVWKLFRGLFEDEAPAPPACAQAARKASDK